ncbi:LysR family transcriptional regulator [Marinomonas sp. C2222]|uniref:LysR family transcriptional regulator n=1 Tax=Marinomonas sargassi TaxID=2984494 RepID=A0ABT2YTJ9_9GAMM|nr:LysR family transcriptional regulator [Marinomonas sargassi]MCV2403222.1 LysR family transcriptional regulator [Marinomonas sargassi]
MIPKITLEQWATFKAVVDEGSFAKAAEQLNKSQSTVSYSLSKMEQRLPSPIFNHSGRKAELTEFGESMYRHASTLLAQALQLDQAAQYLASGWQDEVTIAVDALASMEDVFKALQLFSTKHPDTRIRILETTLSGTIEALIQRDADIVITPHVPPGFFSENYRTITRTLVVAPSHPLAKASYLNEDLLKTHRQIVVRDSGAKRNQDAGWLDAKQRWTVSHLSSSVLAVKSGLGFGFIPKDKIRTELENGELVELDLEYGSKKDVPIYLVASAQSHAGIATKTVLEYLQGKRT